MNIKSPEPQSHNRHSIHRNSQLEAQTSNHATKKDSFEAEIEISCPMDNGEDSFDSDSSEEYEKNMDEIFINDQRPKQATQIPLRQMEPEFKQTLISVFVSDMELETQRPVQLQIPVIQKEDIEAYNLDKIIEHVLNALDLDPKYGV